MQPRLHALRAIVLGSAAGGGFPQWNCRCAACVLAWHGDPRVSARTQSSLAVTADDEAWILLNASPDLGVQIRARRDLWPRQAPRHSPIAAVVLTSAEVDHVAGLLHLRERQPLRLVALQAVHEALEENSIFDVLAQGLVERVVVRQNQPFEIAGVTIELVPVPGKAPLFLEGEDPRLGSQGGETAGVLVSSRGKQLAYVPGCADLIESLLSQLEQADIVFFDGTVFTDDEMIAAGAGAKTGRRMGHIPISGAGGSLEALSTLRGRKIYTHINNTNPILVDGSAERRAVAARGVEVAYDGMEIRL